MDEQIRNYLREGRQAVADMLCGHEKPVADLPGRSSAPMRAGRWSSSIIGNINPGTIYVRSTGARMSRSERLTVKLYQDEVRPAVDILLDGSQSMALVDSEKLRASLGLAALISSRREMRTTSFASGSRAGVVGGWKRQ